MRYIYFPLLFFIFAPLSLLAQKQTKSFTVKGEVKQEITIGEGELKNLTVHTIGTIDITNHKGEVKGKAKDMNGILLREILERIVLNEGNPKLFSEFYFVCEGSDKYKAVFSWNELFNTAVSENVFLVTEKDGNNMLNNEDGLLIISSQDFKTGRRFVKNLETIYVRRTE